MKKILAFVLGLLLPALPACAQTQTGVIPGFMAPAGTDGCPATLACFVPYSATYPLPVNASVSASVTVAPLTSTNAAGSIAVTNTFQSIQVSTAGRNGCLIQNQSTTNAMWVYFGAIGGATKAKSFILDSTHGLAISCSVGGLGVVTDQISITGTSGDLYNANLQ